MTAEGVVVELGRLEAGVIRLNGALRSPEAEVGSRGAEWAHLRKSFRWLFK